MPPPTTKVKKTLADRKAERQAHRKTGLKSIMIAGLAGSGKTTLAATYFSPEVSTRLALSQDQIKTADWLELKGALWIEADEDGLTALTSKKIEPEFVVPLSDLELENKGNPASTVRELHALIGEASQAGAHTMVVDTATSFGSQFLERWYVDDSPDGNGFAGWMTVGKEQTKLLAAGKACGLRQFWLVHPTENKLEVAASGKKATELDRAKATAQSVAGGGNYLVPALSGKKFPPILNGFVSDTFWLKTIAAGGGKKSRTIHVESTDGFVGKTRNESLLSSKEPADLYVIDHKIKDALGGD